MGKRTALFDKHVENGARIVDFAGWDMPIHYGSQLEEHHRVRREAGMFDVSHMTVVDVIGSQADKFLQRLLANDVSKLTQPGKALYSCMLNEQGGVLDDLVVYGFSENRFRVVLNAATRDKDLQWMHRQASGFSVTMEERGDLAMIAVQGPLARHTVMAQLTEQERKIAGDLDPFYAAELASLFVARTGYTGEDGFEIMLANESAPGFWQDLFKQGVYPIGLGARDTLRLEAGLNLYGSDMDEHTTPLESGLGWTVAWQPVERDFIGRCALEAQRSAGVRRKLVGLVLEGKGIPRAQAKVIVDNGEQGEITSGTYSPTLGAGIALARIPMETGRYCTVEIRSKRLPARVVKPPFVRQGKSCLSDPS
jgi:aminomethyltransferase